MIWPLFSGGLYLATLITLQRSNSRKLVFGVAVVDV